ncbi:MAG TPA: hypothetical protein VH639_05595 [Bryobacteraceae bacterium]|jgi:hypothetical protein
MAKGTQPDYGALIAQILTQAVGPLAIETPQLGRVEFQRPQDAYAAVNLVRMLQAQASGVSSTGVIVATYNDGLGCPQRSFSS